MARWSPVRPNPHRIEHDHGGPMSERIRDVPHGPGGMSRRQLLRHSAWFGSAVVLAVAGGEVISHIAGAKPAAAPDTTALRFVQISDSHLGFKAAANTAVEQSFAEAIEQINALPYEPAFVMHTGDLTHLATAAQFDQVRQMMSGLRAGRVVTVP